MIQHIIDFSDGVSTGGMILFICSIFTGRNNLLRFVGLVCMSQFSVLSTCLEPEFISNIVIDGERVRISHSFFDRLVLLQIFWMPVLYFTYKRYNRMGWRTER